MRGEKRAELQIHELKTLLRVDTDAALATKLEIDASTVASWRRRGSVPRKYAYADQKLAHDLDGSHAQFKRQIEARIFALVAIAAARLRDEVQIADEDQLNLFLGNRLRNLYYHLQDQFRPEENEEGLQRAYQRILTRLNQSKVLEWIETVLPPYHFYY